VEKDAAEENDHGENDVIGNNLLGRNIGLAKPTIDRRTDACFSGATKSKICSPVRRSENYVLHTTPLAAFSDEMKAFEKDGGHEEQKAQNRASGFEKLKAEYSIQGTPDQGVP
jgi:hypothetical protein